MRAASKLVKRQALRRRISSEKVGGFTIVETMIVLAVTGAMFLLAFKAIGGRQNETEFQQAINDLNSSLQKEINSVDSGNFQGANNLSCDGSTGSVQISVSGSAADTEGSNKDCIFVGKAVQFYTSTGSQPKQYITYPIAGLRGSGSTLYTNINQVKPIAIAPDNGASGNPSNSFPDDGIPTTLLYGLNIASMNFVQAGGATEAIGGFAVMSNVGAGPQQFVLVPMRGTQYTHDSYDTVNSRPTTVSWLSKNLIWSYSTAINLLNSNTAYSVQICLASGTTKQSGLIKIGGNGGNLNSVTTTIFSNTTCA